MRSARPIRRKRCEQADQDLNSRRFARGASQSAIRQDPNSVSPAPEGFVAVARRPSRRVDHLATPRLGFTAPASVAAPAHRGPGVSALIVRGL
jgi:hypothetical protein